MMCLTSSMASSRRALAKLTRVSTKLSSPAAFSLLLTSRATLSRSKPTLEDSGRSHSCSTVRSPLLEAKRIFWRDASSNRFSVVMLTSVLLVDQKDRL
ncbi:hypothetical protein D3C84_1080460 [compost metagenome]